METNNKNRKMLSDEQRLLRQWAMELANYLRYKESWPARRAMRQAWLCQHALEAMGKGVVQFSYRKKDGTMRTARGTLCREASAAFAAYEYVKAVEEVVWPRATFSYWDVDKNGFRSFRAEQLKEIN